MPALPLETFNNYDVMFSRKLHGMPCRLCYKSKRSEKLWPIALLLMSWTRWAWTALEVQLNSTDFSWVFKRWTLKAPSHISSFKTVSGVMSNQSWGDSWSMSISVRKFQRCTRFVMRLGWKLLVVNGGPAPNNANFWADSPFRPYSDLTGARHLQFIYPLVN